MLFRLSRPCIDVRNLISHVLIPTHPPSFLYPILKPLNPPPTDTPPLHTPRQPDTILTPPILNHLPGTPPRSVCQYDPSIIVCFPIVMS